MAPVIQRIKARLTKPLRRLIVSRHWYMAFGPLAPISALNGSDRGSPIDRYFIEAFLKSHERDVQGAVLEVKDRHYTTRFGGQRVSRSDVLDINQANADANVIDDLRGLRSVADGTYDCLIITQVLQYVDDLDAAIAAMYRVLRPGGVALITVPTVGKFDGQEDAVAGNYWRLTRESCRYLFARRFPQECVQFAEWGNLRLGMGFLCGLSVQDMSARELNTFDPAYACGVFIRAVRPV